MVQAVKEIRTRQASLCIYFRIDSSSHIPFQNPLEFSTLIYFISRLGLYRDEAHQIAELVSSWLQKYLHRPVRNFIVLNELEALENMVWQVSGFVCDRHWICAAYGQEAEAKHLAALIITCWLNPVTGHGGGGGVERPWWLTAIVVPLKPSASIVTCIPGTRGDNGYLRCCSAVGAWKELNRTGRKEIEDWNGREGYMRN